ncbi:hypothetical protein K5D56_23425 [Pseudomonas cichorii]|uniref:SH3 domain-containing protein n=2 Tax=Pseudomonas syringae group TaxID=136849 RepID=A0ABX8HY32_9PSED|nr:MULTISPECIES: hypothetical protein [Pseudomonas]MBX8498630.1 hypothetical protein [Pseudomonas lijiangensis]MBX8503537.1 hypothetical protein [Pseudomonas lijiangensis]MBX8547854.1 hypothetical protein [Pseudomonas cichorii]MBX8592320.1 hypothetical protein [Pseudomonas cichorii]MDO7926785.1 hypothetical protein [Pseudomonas sp. KFB-138]
MNLLKKFLVTLCIFYPFSVFSCEVLEGKAFRSISVENGIITFDLVPIDEDARDTSGGEQLGIDINFFNCNTGDRSLIGQLPFLADTGEVKAAFLANAEQGREKELFVIHGVEIRSDTGLKYSGEYYSVHAYKKSSNGYTKDDKLSKYFGEGGDILADDYKEVAYLFPYKSKDAVTSRLQSEFYKKWSSGTPVTLVVNKKSSLYNSPVLADMSRKYLVAGDKVTQEAVEAGWISVVYKTAKGKLIRGWIQCGNVDGC